MSEKLAAAKIVCCGYWVHGGNPAKLAILFVFIILLADYAIAQPQATLKCHPCSVPLNRNLEVTLELVWAGEVDVYDIPQPDLSGLASFEIVERSLSAARKNGHNQLRFDFIMKPSKEGEYDLAGMKANYFEKGKDIPVAVVLPQTVVKVVKPELLSRRVKMGIGLGLGVAAGIMAVLAVVRQKKKFREILLNETKTAGRAREELLTQLRSIRTFRIEGDIGKYLERLCGLAGSDALRGYVERQGNSINWLKM